MKTTALPPREAKALESFVAHLQAAYGQDLKSVVLYGSAASGGFIAGKSDINVLVVLTDAGIGALAPLIDFLKKPAMECINPVFFNETDVASSLDIFPIEFLDMGEKYEVLAGADVLRDLEIDRRNLRFQVEQELKSCILKTRAAYVRCTTRAAAARLLESTLSAGVPILRNALRLKDAAVPRSKEETVTLASSFFSFDARPFLDAMKMRDSATGAEPSKARAALAALMREMEQFARSVDAL